VIESGIAQESMLNFQSSRRCTVSKSPVFNGFKMYTIRGIRCNNLMTFLQDPFFDKHILINMQVPWNFYVFNNFMANQNGVRSASGVKTYRNLGQYLQQKGRVNVPWNINLLDCSNFFINKFPCFFEPVFAKNHVAVNKHKTIQ